MIINNRLIDRGGWQERAILRSIYIKTEREKERESEGTERESKSLRCVRSVSQLIRAHNRL